MNFNVVKLPDYAGYTHRIDCVAAYRQMDPIFDWVRENKIPCSIVAYTVWIDEPYVTQFLLRWS